ncbi:hypothetical protein [Kitasatospora aureofaciens]|uniref:hypothetical protein n=1 Tax=Kitasatospora aureofaciens TaxID=1894 RepID=UPI000524FFBA|nr:hypothetical protein [Kitasatospora aureofaciens]
MRHPGTSPGEVRTDLEPETTARLYDAPVRYAADLDASVADAHGRPAATRRRYGHGRTNSPFS